MNLPNKLTIARVIAVPFFIAAYYLNWYIAAFVIFVAASFTDMLDGKIARKNNLVTNFGKIILAREFTVAGMRTVAASEGIVIAADMSGKIKTVLQMIAVSLLLLVPACKFYLPLWYTAQAFLWASLIMTVYSGIEYVWKNRQLFSYSRYGNPFRPNRQYQCSLAFSAA